MKKFFLFLILITAIGYNIDVSKNSQSLLESSLFGFNKLAVAEDEIGGPGTCGYKLWAYDQWNVECGVNAETIVWILMVWGAENVWYCCDSCGTSTYCCPTCG